MKLDADGAKRLYQSGLLFEVNRRILHPFGLALTVVISPDEKEVTFGGVMSTDDLEGASFSNDAYRAGINRFEQFMTTQGESKLRLRLRRLGYVVQGPGDLGADVAIQRADEKLWRPAKTEKEAELQQALRRIHASIMDPELDD